MKRDLQVIVIADGVASMHGDDLHVFGLQNVSRCLGWVLTADEFLHLLAAPGRPASSRLKRLWHGWGKLA